MEFVIVVIIARLPLFFLLCSLFPFSFGPLEVCSSLFLSFFYIAPHAIHTKVNDYSHFCSTPNFICCTSAAMQESGLSPDESSNSKPNHAIVAAPSFTMDPGEGRCLLRFPPSTGIRQYPLEYVSRLCVPTNYAFYPHIHSFA